MQHTLEPQQLRTGGVGSVVGTCGASDGAVTSSMRLRACAPARTTRSIGCGLLRERQQDNDLWVNLIVPPHMPPPRACALHQARA